MLGFKNKELTSIEYSVRVSPRAKHLRIAIYPDSRVVVTLPLRFRNPKFAKKFVKAKQAWILKSLSRFKGMKGKTFLKSGKRDYAERKKEALALAKTKVEYWSKVYNIPVAGVTVRNQKTRWGSASKKGRLNFNYNIVKLREELVDYLVVHELCHLKEFNHSKKFWGLVAQATPEYKKLRKELKTQLVK